MAIKKATTTDDLAENEQQVANREQAEKVSELTDPATNAEVEQPKTVKVTSPTGSVTEVPEGIVEALLDSGYSKSK
jgi:hypothetical protein